MGKESGSIERADDGLYRRLFEGLTDYAVIVTDADRRVVTWNAGAEQLLGYSAAEMVGAPADVIFTPEDIAAGVPAAEARAALATGRAADDRWHRRKDGSRFWATGVMTPLAGPAGGPPLLAKVLRDQTALKTARDERALTDEALRASELRFRRLLEANIVGGGISNRSGRWVEANDALLALLGHTREELRAGRVRWDRMTPPEYRPLDERAIAEAAERGACTPYEKEYVRADGTRVPVLIGYAAVSGVDDHYVCFVLDLTNQKRVERDLRASEARFRSLFEAMDEGYCVVEPVFDAAGRAVDYRYLLANPALERHTGLKDIVGRTAREVMPNHEQEWVDAYARVAVTGEPLRREGQVEDLGRWYEVSAARIGPPERRQVGVVFSDVTDRHRAAEALRASEQQLADVFRHAPSFMAVLRGPDHVFERANDRYVELVSGRELIGRPVREALPEVAGQGFIDLLDRVYRTGEPYVGEETRVVLDPGGGRPPEERFLDFVYQPLRNAAGAVTGVIVQGVDLTARVRAERAAVEAHRRLDSALIAGEVGTFEWDVTADRLHGDANFARIFGIAVDPAGAPLERFVQAIHPDDRPRVLDLVRRTVDTGVDYEAEYRVVSGDATRWVVARGRGVREAPGGPVTLFPGVVLDITERKRAEEAVREADRRKDEFLALLAHELRNPLAPLRNGLQVMRLAANDGAAVGKARDMMERQLGHMVRLIDDLLDVSRISRNKMELRRDQVLLADVVASAVETARPVVDAGGHTLTVSLPSEPVYLDADLTRLSQVFSNLLTNAAKYTSQGGNIWLTAERSGGDAVVAVRDTGIGIPADALSHIFDMFSQVDRSIERSTGGLGIGLALVKGLVEMHGGAVTAASDGAGRGSVFTVRLPLAAVQPGVPEVAASRPKGTGFGPARRVLVVDDNRDSAASMAAMLELLGHEVRTAHDGVEAVEAAEAFRPDVILMDVGMPRLNGYDATRRIRGLPWGRRVRVVALTGWGQDGDRLESRHAGCDDHLVKPVHVDDLITVLSRDSLN